MSRVAGQATDRVVRRGAGQATDRVVRRGAGQATDRGVRRGPGRFADRVVRRGAGSLLRSVALLAALLGVLLTGCGDGESAVELAPSPVPSATLDEPTPTLPDEELADRLGVDFGMLVAAREADDGALLGVVLSGAPQDDLGLALVSDPPELTNVGTVGDEGVLLEPDARCTFASTGVDAPAPLTAVLVRDPEARVVVPTPDGDVAVDVEPVTYQGTELGLAVELLGVAVGSAPTASSDGGTPTTC